MEQQDKPENRSTSPSTALSQNGTGSELTLEACTKGPAFMSLVRENGKAAVVATIAKELMRVAEVCGGGVSQESIVLMSELILDRWRGRTVNALLLMLRDGLNSGKIYGKLTYPVIAEWMIEHEEKVEEANYQKHLATK
jgi:hypothetical protein